MYDQQMTVRMINSEITFFNNDIVHDMLILDLTCRFVQKCLLLKLTPEQN